MSRMMHLRYLIRDSQVALVREAHVQDGVLHCRSMPLANASRHAFTHLHVMNNDRVQSFRIQPQPSGAVEIRNTEAIAAAIACGARYNWLEPEHALPFEVSIKDDGCNLPNIPNYMCDFEMSVSVPTKMFTTGMGPLSVDKTNTPEEEAADLMGIPGNMEKRENRYIVAAPLTYLLDDQQDKGTTRNKSCILIRSSDRPSTYLKPSVQCAQPRSFESEVFGLSMISWGQAMVMVSDWLCTLFHVYETSEKFHTFYGNKTSEGFLIADPFLNGNNMFYFERAQEAVLASLNAPRPDDVHEAECNCSAKQKKRKRGVVGCADEIGCYRTSRRNHMHLMSAGVFGKEDAQVQGPPLYLLIMRHLLEQKAQRHLFDKRLKPDVPRKCMVDMQQVWPLLVRLLYVEVIEDGTSATCDCCKGMAWPSKWGGVGCDSCCEKKCHCQGFRPWNPPDVASSDIKRICVPCIASVLVDHTYFVREAFSRKSSNTSARRAIQTKTPRTKRKNQKQRKTIGFMKKSGTSIAI